MKKKFWRKLNLIIISLIFLGMIVLFIKVKMQKDEYVIVDILGSSTSEFSLQNVNSSWLIDSIKKGSKETLVSGKNSAEVLDIRSYEEGSNKIAVLKVKLLVAKAANKYRYKQKPLEVGSIIDMVLDNVRLYGNVIAIGDKNGATKENFKKIKIKLYGRRSWFADAIKVGDKVVEEYSNSIQSEVLTKNVELAETTVTTADGRVFLGRDPRLRDIEIELKLRVDSRGGVDYFANYQPIKIGNHLWIPMKNYNLYDVEVIDVKDNS